MNIHSHLTVPGKTGIILILLFFTRCEIPQQNVKTEILWDSYGVPHIYGKNTREMYYAFGWAQAHNHADLILHLYGESRGRAAEYWGQKYIDSDYKMLLFNIPGRAKTFYNKQDREYKEYLDAFVKGINDYAKMHPDAIDKNVLQVLPVTAWDVIGHTLRITCLEFLAGEDIYIAKQMSTAGSNACAVAPSRTRSENAMLVTNPHLPWSGFFLWFEAQLTSSDFNAYGVALVGMPTLSMAFNDHLGWALTVNPIDASDRFELILKDEGYLLDGKKMLFDKKEVTILVKQDNGTLQKRNFEFQYSLHGPVLGQKSDKSYAVRIAGLDNSGIFEQYYKMARAENFNQFESALKMLQNPMFNVIYADDRGNIFYLFNGNIPIRNRGDFGFWRGTLDGSKSSLIWNEIHGYQDLPKVFNPSSGFLQNCNDPPWTCTMPQVLDPATFPSYFAPQGMPLRPQRAMNMIKNIKEVSLDQLIGIKLNTGMEAADRFLDDLLAAVEKYPDPIAIKAAAILKTWDKKTDAGSKGAVLFARWFDRLGGDMFSVPWNADDPASTPDGLKDQKKAVEMLVMAAGELQKKYGTMEIAWGDVYRFRMDGMDYPANGGPGDYGIFRTIYYTDDQDNKKFAIAGESYVAITEFGKNVKAMVLLSYGNASQSGSKHRGDQLKLLSEKKLREAWLEKTEVLNHLEERESPVMGTEE